MLEQTTTIGFLGLGEAGFHISRGLLNAGVSRIAAFDIHQDAPGRGEKIRERADSAGVLLVASNAELLKSSEVILSTVTADQALQAAEQSAPNVRAAHTYADLNSVSPNTKKSIAEVIQSAGAKFVEIAIMAPVPPYGHKVPMLAGGPAAADFAARFSALGVRVEVAGSEIGIASATKMCRSIMVKGLEALITECMLAASYYGADERVLASLAESFPAMDWPKLANYMVGRVVVHGHRRAREMEEVAETLRAAGVDPIMTEAIVRRMDWSVETGLLELFQGQAPASYQDLVAKLRAKSGTSQDVERKAPPVTATRPR